MASNTGINVVSMNKRVINQLLSMQTPTMQNKKKLSVIHRTRNKHSLLMISSKLRVAEATSMWLAAFPDAITLTRRPDVSMNIEVRRSIEVQLFRRVINDVDGTHWCMIKSDCIKIGQWDTQLFSDSSRNKSFVVPYS